MRAAVWFFFFPSLHHLRSSKQVEPWIAVGPASRSSQDQMIADGLPIVLPRAILIQPWQQ